MSLKAKNLPLLVAFLVGQTALLLLVLGDGALAKDALGWTEKGVGALLGTIAVLVLSEILDDDLKARLVFWRWRNPLPGSFAFTQYAQRDSRVDPALLASKHGQLPTDPAEQNRLWYRLFKTHRDKPNLSQSHGRYLLLREMTAISALLVLPLGTAALALSAQPRAWVAAYVGVLLLQYLFTAQAANNAGVRLVKNTLAEECGV